MSDKKDDQKFSFGNWVRMIAAQLPGLKNFVSMPDPLEGHPDVVNVASINATTVRPSSIEPQVVSEFNNPELSAEVTDRFDKLGFSDFMKDGRFNVVTNGRGALYKVIFDQNHPEMMNDFLSDIFNFASIAKQRGVDLAVSGTVQTADPDALPKDLTAVRLMQEASKRPDVSVVAKIGPLNPERIKFFNEHPTDVLFNSETFVRDAMQEVTGAKVALDAQDHDFRSLCYQWTDLSAHDRAVILANQFNVHAFKREEIIAAAEQQFTIAGFD